MKGKSRTQKIVIRMMKVMNVLMALALLGGVLISPAYAQDGNPPGGGESGGKRGGPIVAALDHLGVLVIDIMIGISVILMAVGIATGFVGGQFLVTVGQPYGLSGAWMKVISVVLLGLGGMLTIVITNTIIDAVSGLVPPTQIPSI